MQAGNLPPDCYHVATGCSRTQPTWRDTLGKMINKNAHLRPALAPEFGWDLSLNLLITWAAALRHAGGVTPAFDVAFPGEILVAVKVQGDVAFAEDRRHDVRQT